MSGGSVEIAEFDPYQKVLTSPVDRSSLRGYHSSVLMGLVGTLCVHVLLVSSLGFAAGAQRHKTESHGVFPNRGTSQISTAEKLVLITVDRAPPDRSALAQQIASLAPRLESSDIYVLSPDPAPTKELIGDPDSLEPPATLSAEDSAAKALMLERYLSQISARVGRVWLQSSPRTNELDEPPSHAESTSDTTFKCRVQIRQDAAGNVQEVLLLDCAGPATWQRALVSAIFQASPLNAPPIASVFSRALTMTFEMPIQGTSRSKGT